MSKKSPGVTRREFLLDTALASGALALTGLAPTTSLAGQAEPKLGAQFIGKLEGPEIIRDVAKFPKAVRRGPHARRAREGRQAPAGGAALARGGGPDGRQAPEGSRKVRRALAPRLHRARRHREREPDRLHGQVPDVGLHREQGRALASPRTGASATTERFARYFCARGSNGRMGSRSPRTTSCSGMRRSTRTRSWCRPRPRSSRSTASRADV